MTAGVPESEGAFDRGFTFSEAVSLQVMCADQDEVDRLCALRAAAAHVLSDRRGCCRC